METKNELLRYSRQIILDQIGTKGQQKLLHSKVLVVGAGGLGSPALYYLASAGVGTLGVADFDQVGVSNLNRQILHTTKDIGRKKADSAYDRLMGLNPMINLIKYPYRINVDNIGDIINQYDVIVDTTDNIASRYLISDCCYFMKKPLIEGAVTGFDGILMTILPGHTPCYRCLYPNPPSDNVIPSCTHTGIIGATAGIIGSLQALEAIKIILNIGDILSSRVLYFNGLPIEFEEIKLERKANCPLCGDDATIKALVQ